MGVGLMLSATKTPPRFSLVMTRSDNHLQCAVPTQKQEWVTSKISLMEAEDTDGSGKINYSVSERTARFPLGVRGPS